MFWRRQSTTTAPTAAVETAETMSMDASPISEQPIGGDTPPQIANAPDEMAIFDAVHAPATAEAETGATPEASAASVAAGETEMAQGKGKKAQDRAAKRAEKAAKRAEKAAKAKQARGGGGAFAFGLLLGAGLGAGAALLFAPKSGEEMRSELVETGLGLKNQVGGSTSDVDWRATASPWAGQAADAVQEAAASAETTLRDAQAEAQQAASDVKNEAEDRLQKF